MTRMQFVLFIQTKWNITSLLTSHSRDFIYTFDISSGHHHCWLLTSVLTLSSSKHFLKYSLSLLSAKSWETKTIFLSFWWQQATLKSTWSVFQQNTSDSQSKSFQSIDLSQTAWCPSQWLDWYRGSEVLLCRFISWTFPLKETWDSHEILCLSPL